MVSSRYLMEDPREAGRLRAKVDSGEWVDRYLGVHLSGGRAASLPERGRVLEVGCGPAMLLDAVGRRRPDATCVGLDISLARLIDRAENDNQHVTVGAAHRLPFPANSFDLAYTRMLLQYVPDPGIVVGEMLRVTRPGGWIVLQDLDGQLVNRYPPDAEMDADLAIVLRFIGATGFNPYVGRSLYYLAYSGGLSHIEFDAENYHFIAGRIDPKLRNEWALKLAVARPAIVLALEDRADLLIARFLDYLDRDDTFIFSQLMTVRGRRPHQ